MKYKVIGASVLLLLVSGVAKSIELLEFLKQPQFSQFYAMLSEAKDGGTTMWGVLVKRLDKYTVFAPTDTAINQFGKIGLLRDPGNEKLFLEFIKSHIVAGSVTRDGLRQATIGSGLKTLTDNKILIAEENKVFYAWSIVNLPRFERSQVLYTVEADNGIVHVIDRVLVQPALKDRLDRAAQVVKRYALAPSKRIKQKAGQQILALKSPVPVFFDTQVTTTRR